MSSQGVSMSVILFFIIILSSSADNHFIEQFMKDPTVSGYFQLEKTIKKKIDEMSSHELSKLESLGLFMSITKVYYVHLLPKSFPGRVIFNSCGNDLFHLRKNLREKNFESYRNNLDSYKICLLYKFGGNLPLHFTKALSSLEKIKQDS